MPFCGSAYRSIDVMLAQLPRHTIGYEVENYEHLDLLWGRDVDKFVFPHVLENLRKFAGPVEIKPLSENEANRSCSTVDSEASRQRDVSVEGPLRAGLPYAEVAAGYPFSSESRESDSDETMGDVI